MERSRSDTPIGKFGQPRPVKSDMRLIIVMDLYTQALEAAGYRTL